MQSITRKFLVKKVPDLQGKECISQERFYLYRKNGIVIRVQSNGDIFELERKEDMAELTRESKKISISKDEFEVLSKTAAGVVKRDCYLFMETPRIVMRVYHGSFERLIRAEVEFQSVEEAKQFVPFDWMDREITGTPLAKDETLLALLPDDFQKLL